MKHQRNLNEILLQRLVCVMAAFFILALIPRLLQAQIINIPTETPEQGKAFSEFNHRMAGAFLLAIGILAASSQALPKLSFLGKTWPFLFILPGLYLAAMSDPEVWPMGTQNWIEVFQTNDEARQHKIFAILLVAMGFFELERARGKLGRILATWSFPALAVFGATLLFYHPHTIDAPAGQKAHEMPHGSHGMDHGAHMPAPQHAGHVMTETMLKVQSQHFWFSIVGFAIALCKFLHDGKFWRKPFVPYLWPAFMSVLGLLLILYAE